MRVQPPADEVRPYLELGLQCVGGEDSEAHVRLLCAQGCWEFGYGIEPEDERGDRARLAAEEARAIAQRIGRVDLELIAIDSISSGLNMRGLYGLAEPLDRERVELTRSRARSVRDQRHVLHRRLVGVRGRSLPRRPGPVRRVRGVDDRPPCRWGTSRTASSRGCRSAPGTRRSPSRRACARCSARAPTSRRASRAAGTARTRSSTRRAATTPRPMRCSRRSTPGWAAASAPGSGRCPRPPSRSRAGATSRGPARSWPTFPEGTCSTTRARSKPAARWPPRSAPGQTCRRIVAEARRHSEVGQLHGLRATPTGWRAARCWPRAMPRAPASCSSAPRPVSAPSTPPGRSRSPSSPSERRSPHSAVTRTPRTRSTSAAVAFERLRVPRELEQARALLSRLPAPRR